jgi:hypothetical protein
MSLISEDNLRRRTDKKANRTGSGLLFLFSGSRSDRLHCHLFYAAACFLNSACYGFRLFSYALP